MRGGDKLEELPGLTGEAVHYSPEGHWLVSGGRVQHLVSGTVLNYDASARTAVFTPEGDIIAGEQDGTLARFCRISR